MQICTQRMWRKPGSGRRVSLKRGLSSAGSAVIQVGSRYNSSKHIYSRWTQDGTANLKFRMLYWGYYANHFIICTLIFCLPILTTLSASSVVPPFSPILLVLPTTGSNPPTPTCCPSWPSHSSASNSHLTLPSALLPHAPPCNNSQRRLKPDFLFPTLRGAPILISHSCGTQGMVI